MKKAKETISHEEWEERVTSGHNLSIELFEDISSVLGDIADCLQDHRKDLKKLEARQLLIEKHISNTLGILAGKR